MAAEDVEIFKGKKLSDLFEEIYTNSKKTRKQIKELVDELSDSPYAASPAGAESIAGYIEVGIKNDEHLIKLATVIQKLESGEKKSNPIQDFGLGDIQDLIEEQRQLEESLKNKEEPE